MLATAKEDKNRPPILIEADRLNEAGDYDKALVLYDQLLAQNHDHPHLLGSIGTIFLRNSATCGLGLTLLHFCIDTFKKRGKKVPTEIMVNLAVAYKHSGQYAKCKEWLETAIKISPTVGAYTNYGSMFVENNEPEKGEEALRKAIAMDSSVPMPKWNLSLILLESGRFKEGWEMYESGCHATGMRRERVI